MHSNFFILFLSFWMKIKILGAVDEFHVVSTTQNPSGDSILKQCNNRIEILELQNFKLQKSLSEQETKLEILWKIQKKLEEQETKLQDLSKLHEIIKQQETKLQDLHQTVEKQEKKVQDPSVLQRKVEEQDKKLQDFHKTIEEQESKLQKKIEEEVKSQELWKLQKIIKELEVKLQDLHETVEKQEKRLQDSSVLQRKVEEQVTKLQDFHKTIEEQGTKLQKKIEEEIKPYKLEKKIEEQETKLEFLLKFHDAKEDCADALRAGSNITGVYKILPKDALRPFEVLCDMDLRGGGWTYVLKRFDGSQDFDLGFTDYKKGFGSLTGEFFMGLDHLYQLTGNGGCELLIELGDWEGKVVHAHYEKFSIGSAEDGFHLKVLSGYSGDAGNAINPHVGEKFSTKDHMVQSELYCNNEDNFVEGPWWDINGCVRSQLFGRYYHLSNSVRAGAGIHWFTFHKFTYSLKTAKMLVRC